MADDELYKVIFTSQGEVWEIYAREVSQGGLFGFVEVDGITFGERSQVVIDPSEERLKAELKDVRRLYVPLHAVVRIDLVERQGSARIRASEGKGSVVAPFPVPVVPKPDQG